MQSRDNRFILLFAACAALLYWGHAQRSGGQQSTANTTRHAEPNPLPENPGPGDALRPVSSQGDAPYDRHGGDAQVRTVSANVPPDTKDENAKDTDVEVKATEVTATEVTATEDTATEDTDTGVPLATPGPRVVSVEPQNLAYSRDGRTVTVQFDPQIPIDRSTLAGAFQMMDSKGHAKPPRNSVFNPQENSVTIEFEELSADNYTFTISSDKVKDKVGQPLQADYTTPLFMPVGADTPTISRGITGHTGPNVEFPEYTSPRKIIDGFNPSDHVETRVSRLYYFRDAHRVAQIVNREAKSYNRAAVDMQQQLADKARQSADQATDARRAKERQAIEAARKTREAEQELQQAEQMAATAAREESDLRTRSVPEDDEQGQQALKQEAETAARVAASARDRARLARAKVQQLRETEAQANEESQVAAATEDRARENQFRREVAAAHADPDTYAPGNPASQDPVRQVSVSVIGEGLIQLRGPIKGINVIRTMINQIDAPVGQVRVGVHTVQINGEKGDRMEVVASKIQRYIDHSRFLTLQSAEMFRKAIVQVAAKKASELGTVPGLTQEQRDRSYLYAFFGEDFINELEAMDSEFLHTGNKLLSLHSMDSTSLASAMFIMALAKNATRMQILQTFEAMMVSELPMAEQNYFEAGLTCDGKHKLFDKHCKPEEFQLLSQNARFQSIRGMFNAEFSLDDTMTPIQREFVRLAQIFKSRLIVEMELKQRIMERSVIEERLGNHAEELRLAREKEKVALAKAERAHEQSGEQLSELRKSSAKVRSRIRSLRTKVSDVVQWGGLKTDILEQFLDGIRREIKELDEKSSLDVDPLLADAHLKLKSNLDCICADDLSMTKQLWELRKTALDDSRKLLKNRIRQQADRDELDKSLEKIQRSPIVLQRPPELYGGTKVEYKIRYGRALELENDQRPAVLDLRDNGIHLVEELQQAISVYKFASDDAKKLRQADECLAKVKRAKGEEEGKELDDLFRLVGVATIYADLAREVETKSEELLTRFTTILASLSGRPNFEQVYADWVGLRGEFNMHFEPSFLKKTNVNEMDEVFASLIEAEIVRRAAEENADRSRRPLDHKKFLDMLVDEMEDKYIELLEGTRAHTANLDAYIKRLMTSLDDDFNTQFYYPTFRKVREASQMWDVQMGQVETTTVLANNRAFAKVSPQATMEFDLPKRDILISEAMDGAKAMVQDFGALAQDPTFLAMAKLGSGQPTSTQSGGASGGQSTVRNVLPGMSTDSAESVMSQQGPGGSQFGAALEGLIPDPAIYKFETGTGWEIRPVIQPDGQALVFHFNYMYTTNIREPVRADEKHLGRIKRHYVDTDVQLSNFELREISRYTVALKASRTSRGVPLFEDIPLVGVLFRPQPSDESSLQQNIILGQSTIFPTLFDLMGLRWAPVVADLDPLRLSNDEFVVRNRRRALMNRVFDQSSSKVDEFLRIPEGERRMDLYRSQETIPSTHPDGYQGPGANLRDSQLREGYDAAPRGESRFIPSESSEGSPQLRSRRRRPEPLYEVPLNEPESAPGHFDSSSLRGRAGSPTGVANVDYRAPTGDPRFAGQQTEYVTTQPRRTETRPAAGMQRLPPADGSPRPFPGPILRPPAR